MPHRLLRIGPPLQQSGLHQRFQPPRQHVGRNAEACLELVEPRSAEPGIAQDQHAPRIAHAIERPGDRADVFSKTLPSHEAAYGDVTCIMQVTVRSSCASAIPGRRNSAMSISLRTKPHRPHHRRFHRHRRGLCRPFREARAQPRPRRARLPAARKSRRPAVGSCTASTSPSKSPT